VYRRIHDVSSKVVKHSFLQKQSLCLETRELTILFLNVNSFCLAKYARMTLHIKYLKLFYISSDAYVTMTGFRRFSTTVPFNDEPITSLLMTLSPIRCSKSNVSFVIATTPSEGKSPAFSYALKETL